ncbi:class I SAM-dependent methyltransferase [Pseudosporangium ferrugineum]|uniref:class I SAM-dependent methyltransferase n=1 Tax=Pseudosporangium ferrugineum TaxID=439699 RepID=UPI001FE5D5F2|nr:class I SAM-dependent methyltransferase [Pseudosporangium ferrugineum]
MLEDAQVGVSREWCSIGSGLQHLGGVEAEPWQAIEVSDPAVPEQLLEDKALHTSAVVANCAMNRERQLAGVNSYTRELDFNPLDSLTAAVAGQGDASWLDLCCGTGRALIQAAEHLRHTGLLERVALVGVDLIDAFDPIPSPPAVTLLATSATAWTANTSFDLITCVHGLHYVGDKLAVLARAAQWLTPTGRFVADLDLASIRLADGRPAGRRLTARLRAAGLNYGNRRRRIACIGPRELRLPYTYLGADDHAGPNYTGQPAVDSYYCEHS